MFTTIAIFFTLFSSATAIIMLKVIYGLLEEVKDLQLQNWKLLQDSADLYKKWAEKNAYEYENR